MKMWLKIGKWVVLEMFRAVVRGYKLGKADLVDARLQRKFESDVYNSSFD